MYVCVCVDIYICLYVYWRASRKNETIVPKSFVLNEIPRYTLN